MERSGEGGRRMLADLLDASHLMPLESLPAQAAECTRAASFRQVLIYVADLQRTTLRLVPGDEAAAQGHEPELHVEGTVAGRAYQYSDVLRAHHRAAASSSGGCRCWTGRSASGCCG
ncbi:hypothetical protein [Streptomyces sp. A244]|uniref:hypothetical protein n=1 Tax=Streptomyces sp. A244 TaxID=2137016 RepID=UPI0026CBC238|nr:hypothetical protein [Streptomyces sp. A244]